MASAAPKTTPLKPTLNIKKYNTVSTWTWNVNNEMCSICRTNLSQHCIECQLDPPGDDECKVAWGKCNHAYHFHCVSRWLNTRNVCPLDGQEWEYAKVSDH